MCVCTFLSHVNLTASSSYWTDNGACYYYYTGHYDNYEEALIGVKTYADEQGIPFRYLQVCDSSALSFSPLKYTICVSMYVFDDELATYSVHTHVLYIHN